MGKIWKHLWDLAGISLLVMSMPLFSQETESEAIQPPATPKPKIDSTVVKFFNHSFDSLALALILGQHAVLEQLPVRINDGICFMFMCYN